MQIVSFGVMGFDYIKLPYCSFCDDLSLTSCSGLCKKKCLVRQMLWIDEQCFYTVNGKHSVYLHSDTVMLYPFHMSHVILHKSVKSCVFFKHYVQRWVVNYRASREGDSAVLQAYGKTD